MYKLIRCGDESFFSDKEGNIVYKFDPEVVTSFTTTLEDGSLLSVSVEQIKEMYGGQIYFDYNEDRYILEDGYNNLVVRAGYIVLNNYNLEHILDKQLGLNKRVKLFDYCQEVFKMWADDYVKIDSVELTEPQQVEIKFKKSMFEFTVQINTVSSIVSKNQKRKINNLPYYPFNKNMDKYGTMYMTIFCKRTEGKPSENFAEKYDIAEKFLMKYIDYLNEFSDDDERYIFDKVIVKNRILYLEGI